MLKLKRVELQGFKSFCDRTELRFNGEGIAAIVGPNGCGKSNLSDAISWVLGEQSAKSLRGSRMEDVIFAGTRDRKPLGMAYVTMTLVDPDLYDETKAATLHLAQDAAAALPHHDHASGPGAHLPRRGEITITRRLYRSGESEYLVDGRIARLRDIQDIFMGTGLGPESYAIIEQGRIAQILSSKPQDRRSVIEEAAGITKYKTRKRLAEAKLESAKQNMARVYDILEEVNRQVNSLKRQASKARRYNELKGELADRLKVVLSGKWRLLEREAAKSAIDLNLAAGELKSLSEQVTAREHDHEKQQAVCYQTEQQLTAARQTLADLTVEATRTRGRLESQVKESGALEQRIAQSEQEAAAIEVLLAKLDQEIATHRETVGQLEAEIAGARERMLEINRQREAVQVQMRQREQSLEAGRQVILRLLGEASTLKNQLAQVDEYLAGIDRETARAQREAETGAAEIGRLEAATRQLSDTMSQRQLELDSVSGERRLTEEALGERRRASVELRHQIDGMKTEVSRVRARQESIENILLHRSYTTESVKRLFAELEKSKGTANELTAAGVLADYVEVEPRFEKPAEEFLHEELEYVVVETWQQAERGLDFVRSGLSGRATFLVHPEPNGNGHRHLPEPAIGPETGIVGRLSDSLRLTNGFKDRACDLLPRVSLCFLAEDRAAAQRLAVSYPHLYFLLPDGVAYHGHTVTGGKKTGDGPLALKREARELRVQLQQRQLDLDANVQRFDELTQQIIGLEAELERLRSLQQAREKDRVALEAEMRKLGEELSRANSRLSVARLELERLRRDAEKSVEQRDRNRAAVEEKEQLRVAREEGLEAERAELETLEAQSHTIGEEHAETRARIASIEERHRGERAAMGRLEEQFHSTTTRRNALVPEIERLGVERARLLADNIELDQAAGVLAARILELETDVNRMATEETGLREFLKAGEEELKLLRVVVQTRYETRSQLEVELVQKQAELKFLDETSRKELNCGISELFQPDDVIPDAELIAEAERGYNEVNARIENLGPVNPQADVEFQEAQQRSEFLSAQRQDLIDSIRDTEKAIQEIDTVSRQKFVEAFEAINENFKQCFATLFGGGNAEMRLTDLENAAESGIDIICQPPGKRLQNVLLLSGGEKALSATALLMAIFRYQPSPFCVMDEVDAPLDEANIGRLTRLVQEMSHQTQFVMITHSKRTMEVAQALYGVTMQEPGVSKLVSVKFQTATTAAA